MPPRHTPEQWRELVRQLKAIRDNPRESSTRRQKATDILGIVATDPDAMAALKDQPAPRPPLLTELGWTEDFI